MTTSSTGDATSGGATPPAQDQQPTEDSRAGESAARSSDSGTPRLQMTGIAKRFGAVRAIRHADMTVDVGRVLALVGENGAGKSTLIKVLSGAVTADTGTIVYEGRQVSIGSTSDAMALGIATVYQEPQLFSELTVSENIFMGREIRKGGRIDWAEQTRRVVELLGLLELPPRYATAVVGDLSIAERQQVSIAKALAGEANILILDEPSAILTDAEIEVLFRVVRRLTESGVSVIYISHRLDELFRIANDVLVMRDGQTIGTYPIEELVLGPGGCSSLPRGAVGAQGRRADGWRHPDRHQARTEDRPRDQATTRTCRPRAAR